MLVADINPGSGDSRPFDFIVLDEEVLFRADDGIHGTELWAMSLLTGKVYLPLILRH